MENFSNERNKYWNQIKKELLDLDNAAKIRFQYLELGQLFSHGFSVTQTNKNQGELILKIWDAKFDNSRFDKGIYNLDRIAINKKKVELNTKESDIINRLLESNLELTNWKGIVLDGLFCQFEAKGKRLVWNINEEINGKLNELVKLLRNKVACSSKEYTL